MELRARGMAAALGKSNDEFGALKGRKDSRMGIDTDVASNVIASDEIHRRFREWCRLMAERRRAMTPAERDRLMQQYIAQSQTDQQRAASLCRLMDFSIKQRKARIANAAQ